MDNYTIWNFNCITFSILSLLPPSSLLLPSPSDKNNHSIPAVSSCWGEQPVCRQHPHCHWHHSGLLPLTSFPFCGPLRRTRQIPIPSSTSASVWWSFFLSTSLTTCMISSSEGCCFLYLHEGIFCWQELNCMR